MIADMLKKLRENKKLTQQDVADGINVNSSTYKNYEYGRREPDLETVSKLADFYGVTTDYLLGRDTGEPEPIDSLASQFNMSALEKEILDNYLALPENMRGDLMEFLQKSVEKVMNESGD
ncbi:MAG: helix-turn-helix transcriptional regulator [Ruminococcus sp.]|nr:helix-turn-helix transcriptional regulator [Ruminococcus sp.]